MLSLEDKKGDKKRAFATPCRWESSNSRDEKNADHEHYGLVTTGRSASKRLTYLYLLDPDPLPLGPLLNSAGHTAFDGILTGRERESQHLQS